jgi:DNA replication protein DnaC
MGRKFPDKRMYPVTRAALHRAGVPERYWTASLAPIAEEAAYRQRLVKYLVQVHNHLHNGKSLYLHGGFASGKSFAAVAVLKEAIRRGALCYFLKARDVLRVIYDQEETVDGTDSVRNVIRKVDLLVLDDLGAEGFDPKKHGGAEMEGIVRDIYDSKRTIIVTSNRAPKQLSDSYPESFRNILKRTVEQILLKTTQWKGK